MPAHFVAVFAKRNIRSFALLSLSLLGVATGCTESSVPAPDRGLDYYPVAANSFWIYAVADSTWSTASASNPTSTVQVANYQFRETITSSFTDAAGQTAYRLVRAKRLTPAAAWRDDSVFTIRTDAHGVVLTRNNLKTLELIFPVRDGRLWNFNAFNNNTNDTIQAETRRYRNVGEAFATKAGPAPQTFANTVTTTNEGTAKFDDSYYVNTYQQVFAKAVGPVQRRRRRFSNYFTTSITGINTFVRNAYFYGYSRTETLVDYGPR